MSTKQHCFEWIMKPFRHYFLHTAMNNVSIIMWYTFIDKVEYLM